VLAVPLVRGDTVLSVLDLDSPTTGRFDDDRAGIERVGRIYAAASACTL